MIGEKLCNLLPKREDLCLRSIRRCGPLENHVAFRKFGSKISNLRSQNPIWSSVLVEIDQEWSKRASGIVTTSFFFEKKSKKLMFFFSPIFFRNFSFFGFFFSIFSKIKIISDSYFQTFMDILKQSPFGFTHFGIHPEIRCLQICYTKFQFCARFSPKTRFRLSLIQERARAYQRPLLCQ